MLKLVRDKVISVSFYINTLQVLRKIVPSEKKVLRKIVEYVSDLLV